MRKIFKNFRIWILIGGLMLFLTGLIMQYFGIAPCPGFSRPCENSLWTSGMLIRYLGLLLVILSMVLIAAELFANLMKKKRNLNS